MINPQVRRSFLVLMLVPSLASAAEVGDINPATVVVEVVQQAPEVSRFSKLVRLPIDAVNAVAKSAVSLVQATGKGIVATVDGLGNAGESLVVKVASPFRTAGSKAANFYEAHAVGTKRFTVLASLVGAGYLLNKAYEEYCPVAQRGKSGVNCKK